MEKIGLSLNFRHAHDRISHQDVVIKKRNFPLSHQYLAKRTHREFVLTQIVNHKNVR